MPDPNLATEWLDNGGRLDVHQSRDVVQCKCCGLVQYRTNKESSARRCLRNLPPKAGFLLPDCGAAKNARQANASCWQKSPNLYVVSKIGKRVQLLREAREMTQSQLQAASKVSRSYLSRIESGQMTPSLRTLDPSAVALGIDLNSFFSSRVKKAKHF